jgi:hypothetical protein
VVSGIPRKMVRVVVREGGLITFPERGDRGWWTRMGSARPILVLADTSECYAEST